MGSEVGIRFLHFNDNNSFLRPKDKESVCSFSEKFHLRYKFYASEEHKEKHALETSFAMSVLCNYGSKLFIILWLCLRRTGNYQITNLIG